ncbi:MAG: hypothetical protein ACRENI_15520 [Gemmatimonadaceae bacterium]
MRAYDLAAAAGALNVDRKWLSNLLSHHHVADVPRLRQGVLRRIPPRAILTLEIAIHLIRGLGIPIVSALDLAERLREADDHSIPIGPGIRLTMDTTSIEAGLDRRLREAAESAVPPRRGRPPRHRPSRLP